jgi:hypothetical protein
MTPNKNAGILLFLELKSDQTTVNLACGAAITSVLGAESGDFQAKPVNHTGHKHFPCCPEGKALDNWLQAEVELSQMSVLQQKLDVRNTVPQKGRNRRKA